MSQSTSKKSPMTTPTTGRGRTVTMRLTRPMAALMVGTPMTSTRRRFTSRTLRTAPRPIALTCLGLKSMIKSTPRTWMHVKGSQTSSSPEASTPSWRLAMVLACLLGSPVPLPVLAIREEKERQRRVQRAKVAAPPWLLFDKPNLL